MISREHLRAPKNGVASKRRRHGRSSISIVTSKNEGSCSSCMETYSDPAFLFAELCLHVTIFNLIGGTLGPSLTDSVCWAVSELWSPGTIASGQRRRNAMASHKVVTSDGRHKYACHVCHKMFTDYSNLVRHRRKCEGTGFYLHCPHCHMVFYRRDNYQEHLANKHKVLDTEPRHAGRRPQMDSHGSVLL